MLPARVIIAFIEGWRMFAGSVLLEGITGNRNLRVFVLIFSCIVIRISIFKFCTSVDW